MQRRTGISGGITTRRSLGITLALTSAILFITAGIFTKSVAADALSVIFWRGIFGGVAGLTLLFITRRFWHELAAMRGVGWALTLINASGTIAFISSFKLTSVANVTLVWSTVPILGGLIGWVWFGERVSLAFFASCLLVFIGVFFLFGADIASLDLASGSLVGSLLAFLDDIDDGIADGCLQAVSGCANNDAGRDGIIDVDDYRPDLDKAAGHCACGNWHSGGLWRDFLWSLADDRDRFKIYRAGRG